MATPPRRTRRRGRGPKDLLRGELMNLRVKGRRVMKVKTRIERETPVVLLKVVAPCVTLLIKM